VAKNEKILGYVRHRKDNMIEGDLRAMLTDVLDELAVLRGEHDAAVKRLSKLEKRGLTIALPLDIMNVGVSGEAKK
jgi:hypothetical protein